ncbi:MAG TPA: PKD domain-containing protein [Cytophagaceae bacterium]|jgi:PKD repeat protein
MTTTFFTNSKIGYRLIAFFIFALQGWGNLANAQEKKSPEPAPLCTAGFSIQKESVICPVGYNCLVADHVLATFKADYPSYKDYFWDFGDGQTGQGNPISHHYFKSGEYKVTLNIYSPYVPYGDGPSLQVVCNNSETRVIQIEMPSTAPVCRSLFKTYAGQANEFKFQDVSEGGDHKSFWSFGDGQSAEGEVVKHTYAEAGEYSVSLTIVKYDEKGEAVCKDRSSEVIKVDEIGEPASNCLADLQVTVDGYVAKPYDLYAYNKRYQPGVENYYFWNFGDGTNAVETFPSHTFSKAGKYLITLTKVSMSTTNDSLSKTCTGALTAGGLTIKIPCYRKELCREVYTKWVEIKDPTVDTSSHTQCGIKPRVDTKGRVISYSDGRIHTMELTTRVDLTYWTFGDGTSSTSWAGTHKYKGPGKYLVTLNTASYQTPGKEALVCKGFFYDSTLNAEIPCYYQELCRGSYTMWVEITDPLPTTRCSADIQITQEGNVIKGYDAIITTADYRPEIITHYYWSFGDGTDTTGNLVKHQYSKPGQYLVSVTKVIFDQSALLWQKPNNGLGCDMITIDNSIKYGVNMCVKEVCRETYTYWVVIEDIYTWEPVKCDASFIAYSDKPFNVVFNDSYPLFCATPGPWFCGTPAMADVPNKGILPGGCYLPNNRYVSQFNWTYGDGSDAITYYKNVSHTYKPGKYLVKLVVKSYEKLDTDIRHFDIQAPQPICQDSSQIWITVKEDGSIIVGAEKEVLTNIFPNPLDQNGSLIVENAEQLVDFNIYDLSGMLVKKFEGLNNGTSSFSTYDLPIGIYLYTITQEGRVIKKDKFRVSR